MLKQTILSNIIINYRVYQFNTFISNQFLNLFNIEPLVYFVLLFILSYLIMFIFIAKLSIKFYLAIM